MPSPVLCITTPLRYVVDATPTPPAVGVVPTVKIPAVAIPLTAYRLARVDLNANETFFFEMNYPLVMVDGEKIIVEVTAPSATVGGSGIGSAINYQILGDTDI